MRYLKSNQGSALVIMLFTVAILSLLGMTLISTSLRENKISHYQEDSTAAQYLAEGGIQKALVSLKDHPRWKYDPYWDNVLDREISSGDGSYILTFNEKSGNLLEVVSTGKSRSGEKVLKADVKITRVNKAFENPLASNSQSAIVLSGNADIYGKMHSNTDLILSGNVNIYGDVTCLGKTVLSSNPNIEGDWYSQDEIIISGNPNIRGNLLGYGDLTISGKPNFKGSVQINGEVTSEEYYDIIYGGVGSREPIIFPELSEDIIYSYRETAKSFGSYYEDGDFPKHISDITFIDRGVTISEDISGDGVLFINGNLNLSEKVNITSDKDGAVVLIVKGNVYIQSNGKFKCVIFATGDLSVSENPDIYGSVVAKSIVGSGRPKIYFLDDLQDRLPHDAPGVFETKVKMETLTY